MTDFQNSLILADKPYKNGLFPEIPDFRKEGSIYILTGGKDADIIVDDRTTSRQIRQGKYTRLIEISSRPYRVDVSFESQSKEVGYSFDVIVKAVIQVNDPKTFYANRNLDVDAYFRNLFTLDVRKITRQYSILDYEGMDDELTTKLSSYNGFDDSTGFTYRISIVDAEPGRKAKQYVEKSSTQQLDIKLKQSARDLTSSLSKNIVDAIMTEVVEGKLTEREAFEKIQEYRDNLSEKEMERAKKFRDEGFLSEDESRQYVKSRAIPGIPEGTIGKIAETVSQNKEESDDPQMVDAFYEDKEEEKG